MIDLLGGGGVLVKMVVGKISHPFIFVYQQQTELFTSCELFDFWGKNSRFQSSEGY